MRKQTRANITDTVIFIKNMYQEIMSGTVKIKPLYLRQPWQHRSPIRLKQDQSLEKSLLPHDVPKSTAWALKTTLVVSIVTPGQLSRNDQTLMEQEILP